MDALSGLARIAEYLLAQLISYFPLFADSISSCEGDLNQRIPAGPDSRKLEGSFGYGVSRALIANKDKGYL